ncbi:MAG TPA: succinylglutamate desuccinylase/aspartoacylase family protein [Limnochordales bacterium]
MASKRFLLSAALLAAACLIAACTSVVPTTPTDTPRGAVEFIIDLSELDAQGFVVGGAAVTLVRSATLFEQELAIAGGTATGSVTGVPVGRWQATVDLWNASAEVLATRQLNVDVQRDTTTQVALVARVAGGQVVLEPATPPADGGPGSDPGSGGPGSDPGSGDPGSGPGSGDGGDEPSGGDGPGGGPGGGTGDEPGDDEPGGGNGPGGDPGQDEPGDGPGGGPGNDPAEPPTVTREIRYIQSGSRTETRTEVYIIRSSVPGPTAFLVGGMHGSETSGWIVAGEVAETWNIDRGTLVVIPQANKDAVRRQRRTGSDGRNLNRYFPEGRDLNDPTKDWLLAKKIWDLVLEFRPVALLDLHEGWGLREAGDRFSDGTLSVGQTIIAYPAGDALEFARHAADVLNTYHNPFYGVAGLTYEFRVIGPPIAGSLARKAGADLGIPAFIFEPTQGRAGRHTTTVAQRSHWQRVMVEEFLRWYGLLD